MQRSDLEVEVSKFFNDDRSRGAVVYAINGGTSYVIDLYAGETLVDYMVIKDKSLHFVEDAAENYVLGIYRSPLEHV
jgi:hypothetical protein